MDFNRYFTNGEVEQQLVRWQEGHPDLCRLEKIGLSHEGRPVWIMTVTTHATGADLDKPAVWADANVHSTEIAGTTVVLALIDALLTGYRDGDQRIRRLLDTSTFYCVPRMNPDGAELAMAARPRYTRSGTRPYPWPEKEDGLHGEDVDGDGRILQMRIEDPNGDWKRSRLDPRLMERRRPDDHGGTYYRILPEGRIENYDGYLIERARAHAGLDFNRNFPSLWRSEGEQRGAGPFPASEPEIRGMVEFVAAHPNINCALSYHTYSGLLLRPFATRSDDVFETKDLWVYDRLGKRGSELTGYRAGPTSKILKYLPKEVISGTAEEWLFDHRGIFAWIVEIWDIWKQAGVDRPDVIEWFRDHPHEDDVRILRWYEESVNAGGYVDWHWFDHPQLGRLELGGWDAMYTWDNPPHAYMGEEARKNVAFALSLGDVLPRIELHTLKVDALGVGSYRVTLVVQNTGYLPTFTSQQGKKSKYVRPVRAELTLPDEARLLTGTARVEIGHLEGRSNKVDIFLDVAGPTDHRGKIEWMIAGKAGTTMRIAVKSERAGSFHVECMLPA
jgi:murein tripeptide amidase MpaA